MDRDCGRERPVGGLRWEQNEAAQGEAARGEGGGGGGGGGDSRHSEWLIDSDHNTIQGPVCEVRVHTDQTGLRDHEPS